MGDAEKLPEGLSELLAKMGLHKFAVYLEGIGCDKETLMSLQARDLAVMLPNPSFSLFDRLTFSRKYCNFMTAHKLELHESFGYVQPETSCRPTTSANDSTGALSQPGTSANSPINAGSGTGSQDATAKSQATAETGNMRRSSRARKTVQPVNASNWSDSDENDFGDNIDSEESVRLDDEMDKVSSESDEEPLSKKRMRWKSTEPQAGTSNSHAEPLVDKTKLGSARKAMSKATAAIDDLDLKAFFSNEANGQCDAVLMKYETEQTLKKADRNILASKVVEWLMIHTQFPSHEHYMTLSKKICTVFPTERVSIWFQAPKTESEQQKSPKGILYGKVKNYKTFLRKKGKLPAVKRSRKNKGKLEKLDRNVDYTDDEKASTEWLKRNHEPEGDVRTHWRRCSKPRLRELIVTNKLSPNEYVETWYDILKQPFGYQLVTHDFEVLPDVIERYTCLKDKSDSFIRNWSCFAERVVFLVEHGKTSLSKMEVNSFKKKHKSAESQNNKDYLILQLLPSICKQKGRVKVGRETIKPSAVESKEAFIIHITDAGEITAALKGRHDRSSKVGASVQPYVLVLGENEQVARASYVIVNQIPWKVGGVLAAIDICFKTCFVLHSSYPPEAMHLWYLIQQCLYKVELFGDPVIESVVTLIDDLNRVEVVEEN